MPALRSLQVLLVGGVLAACGAPRVVQLEGLVVHEGTAITALARRAGVSGTLDRGGGVGNLVVLDAQHALSVRHVVPRDAPALYRHGGARSAVRVVQVGAADRDDTWTLLAFEEPFVAPACALELGGAVDAGQEALLLGYSQRLSAGAGIEPVAVRARLRSTPRELAGELAGFLVFDVGGEVADLGGLSGAPLLTRDGPQAAWRWVGLFEATVETNTGERFGIAHALPVDVIAALRGS